MSMTGEIFLYSPLARVEQQSGSPPADNAFHVSQLAIVLDRTHPLLETFAAGLRDGIYDSGSSEYVFLFLLSKMIMHSCARYPTMTRFFAHLCLFLQMIDVSVPPLATQVILEAYLQVLEVSVNHKLTSSLILTISAFRVPVNENLSPCMPVHWAIMLWSVTLCSSLPLIFPPISRNENWH